MKACSSNCRKDTCW